MVDTLIQWKTATVPYIYKEAIMAKKVKQFSDLSERERFKLKKRLLKRSYKEGRWLLNDVRCVRPSKRVKKENETFYTEKALKQLDRFNSYLNELKSER